MKLTDDVKQRKQKHFKQYRTAKQKLTNKENLVRFLHRGKPTASTPGTSHDSQLSDSDSVEPVGSSRNKLKRDSEDLLVESSDDEARSQTAQCEGYRLIDLKNLSSSASSAHVCKGGENFLSVASSVTPFGLLGNSQHWRQDEILFP